jgi:hypothetical protein
MARRRAHEAVVELFVERTDDEARFTNHDSRAPLSLVK